MAGRCCPTTGPSFRLPPPASQAAALLPRLTCYTTATTSTTSTPPTDGTAATEGTTNTSSGGASAAKASAKAPPPSQSVPLWVPGNPQTEQEVAASQWMEPLRPADDEAQKQRWLQERVVYPTAFPGCVPVTEEVARRAPLRRVAASLFTGLERDGRLAPGQEARAWARWEAALARLERDRGVTSLDQLAALPRVVWWRTRLPHAFRAALNVFLYHGRLPSYALPPPHHRPSSSP